MLKREGKAPSYTKTLDGGWGWMIVFHFFLVSICFPFQLPRILWRKPQSGLTRSLRKSWVSEWTRGQKLSILLKLRGLCWAQEKAEMFPWSKSKVFLSSALFYLLFLKPSKCSSHDQQTLPWLHSN